MRNHYCGGFVQPAQGLATQSFEGRMGREDLEASVGQVVVGKARRLAPRVGQGTLF